MGVYLCSYVNVQSQYERAVSATFRNGTATSPGHASVEPAGRSLCP